MKMLHTIKKTKIEKFFKTKALQSHLKETSVFLKNVSPKVSESHSINPSLGRWGNFTHPLPDWFPFNNSETVKAVTLAFCCS